MNEIVAYCLRLSHLNLRNMERRRLTRFREKIGEDAVTRLERTTESRRGRGAPEAQERMSEEDCDVVLIRVVLLRILAEEILFKVQTWFMQSTPQPRFPCLRLLQSGVC